MKHHDIVPFLNMPVIVTLKGSFMPMRCVLGPSILTDKEFINKINSIELDEHRLAIDLIKLVEANRSGAER